MKINYLKKILNFLFPIKKFNNEKLNLLLKNKIIFFQKEKQIIFFHYKNNFIKKIIFELKFKKNFRVSQSFGKIIYENLPEILIDLKIQEDFNDPILITIPISFRRKLSRGYDHNFLIIKSFFDLGGKNFIY
jgi:predicted amidophosphoribosyltransferase